MRRRMAEDIAGNRQIDLWVTLTIAFVVGILGVFDVVNESVVASATLAVLGLVSVASLGGRMQIATLTGAVATLVEDTQSRLNGEVSADRLLSASSSGTDSEFDGATDIRIIGVTLARTVRNQYDMLERRLLHGAVIRIAIIAPTPEVLREAARRSTIPESPEIFENRLRPTLDLLAQLGRTPGAGRLEVRLLSFVPAFGLIAIDPDESRGIIRVDIYSHRSTGQEPTMPLRADRDRRWYTHFLREFDRIWWTGEPVG
jgi:hypothetical protein